MQLERRVQRCGADTEHGHQSDPATADAVGDRPARMRATEPTKAPQKAYWAGLTAAAPKASVP